MNININDYIPTHKYIRLYENEEDYNEDVNNHVIEECAYSLVNENNTEIQQSYYPSTRTTNNDNTVKFNYFDKDKINIWAGLSIIWGYFGFQKATYNCDGIDIIGGNFTFIRPMNVVKEVPDGYTLQHLNNFLRYAPIRSITEIQYFDTSNIESVSYVFYYLNDNCVIDKRLLNNWKKLKYILSNFTTNINIYNNIEEDTIIDFSSLKQGFYNFTHHRNSPITYITNTGDLQKFYNSTRPYFSNHLSFKLDSLEDEYFIDNVSYNHIKTLFNNNIFEYTFGDYVINLNSSNCYITHKFPIYDNFTYNLNNELGTGTCIIFYTDNDYTNTDILSVVININNNGNTLYINNSNNNKDNIFNINFLDDSINITAIGFININDNNIILNKDINYNRYLLIQNCTINKNIAGGGVIDNSVINGTVKNLATYILNISDTIFNNTVNIYANNINTCTFNKDATINIYADITISNSDFIEDLIISKANSIKSCTLKNCNINNLISNQFLYIESSTINNIDINDEDTQSYIVYIIDTTINTGSIYQKMDIDLNNCIIDGQIDIEVDNKKITLSDLTINENGVINIIKCCSLTLENIVFNNNINYIVQSFNNTTAYLQLTNVYYIGNDYFINVNSYTDLFINTIQLTYNDDENYDINNLINSDIISASYIINSNKAINTINCGGCSCTLNEQNTFNINIFGISDSNINNKFYRYYNSNIIIISDSIQTININIKSYKNNYNTSHNTFNFTECILLQYFNINVEQSISGNCNTLFDFTNCLNLDINTLYTSLINFASNAAGNHIITIENNVYLLLTEEMITNLLSYYIINIVHQENVN